MCPEFVLTKNLCFLKSPEDKNQPVYLARLQVTVGDRKRRKGVSMMYHRLQLHSDIKLLILTLEWSGGSPYGPNI